MDNNYENDSNFNHTAAQKYELNYHINWLKQNFDKLYEETQAARSMFESHGEITIGEEKWLPWFFKNSDTCWKTFVNKIKDKPCLEVGTGPCGVCCKWHFIKTWYAVDPLLTAYNQTMLEMFHKSWIPDSINMYSQSAEILIPELINKINGAIVCVNALDHVDEPLRVMDNLSEYAVPGCKLLLWADIYYPYGHDEGHRNLCKSPEIFRSWITDRNFSIDYETTPIREKGSRSIEFGCVATKL